MPLLYQQSKTLTPARSNIMMGHVHISSLEQSCQGATYYKQPILVR